MPYSKQTPLGQRGTCRSKSEVGRAKQLDDCTICWNAIDAAKGVHYHIDMIYCTAHKFTSPVTLCIIPIYRSISTANVNPPPTAISGGLSTSNARRIRIRSARATGTYPHVDAPAFTTLRLPAAAQPHLSAHPLPHLRATVCRGSCM
jgi:hypothetical protein